MAQHITLSEVKAAAIKAYREGRLVAQSNSPSRCVYSYECSETRKQLVCGIGAVLSQKTLSLLEGVLNDMPISESTKEDFQEIVTWDENEQDGIEEIQHAHDRWLQYQQAGLLEVTQTKNRFLSLIGLI